MVGGDLLAMKAKYHNNCLRSLKNRYRSLTSKSDEDFRAIEKQVEGQVFDELVTYIEGIVEEGTFIFELSELQSFQARRNKCILAAWWKRTMEFKTFL